jgi:DNA-binding NarL/FixJ family response regulator
VKGWHSFFGGIEEAFWGVDLPTSREREVLQMAGRRQTNKEIAVVLNLSVYTVDAHRGRIMEKSNCTASTNWSASRCAMG